MNKNNFLIFFYKLIDNDYLDEKTKIRYILKNKTISEKDTEVIQKKIEKVVVEVELENKKILLIEDFAINFLISYGILIGNKCEVLEFKLIDEKSNLKEIVYVCEKSLFEKIKNKIKYDENSLKKVSFRDLYGKKFKMKFKKPKLILDLEDYILNVKKLDMKKIHIINSSKIENFIPNVKNFHFKLAKSMQIPIIELIKDNFIKSSTINVYDESKLKQLLSPIFISEEIENVVVSKKNEVFLYKDIEKNYYLNVNKFYKKIVKILINTKIVNFERNSILNKIKKIKFIKLSSYYGNIPLPIWRCQEENKYLKIKNESDFKQISGLNLNLDNNLFDNVYLQSLSGNKVIYKNRYLRDELKYIFENFDGMLKNQKIVFENIVDLIFQLIFYEDKINEKTQILIKNNLNTNNEKEFINGIEWLLNKVLKIIIEKNHKVKIKTIFSSKKEVFYYNLGNLIRKNYSEFLKNPSKKKLLKESLKNIVSMKKIIQNYSIKIEETFFLLRNLKFLIRNLNEFDCKKSKEFFTKIELFLDKNLSYDDGEIEKKNCETVMKKMKREENSEIVINDEIIKLFNDLNLVNDLSKNKNKKIFVLIKEKQLEKEYFLPNINFISTEPIYKEYVKPNVTKIKKIFKYSSKEVISKINKLRKENLKTNGSVEIIVKNRKAILKKDFYEIFKKYDRYKTICENKYFISILQ